MSSEDVHRISSIFIVFPLIFKDFRGFLYVCRYRLKGQPAALIGLGTLLLLGTLGTGGDGKSWPPGYWQLLRYPFLLGTLGTSGDGKS